jgi:hypothetical protein
MSWTITNLAIEAIAGILGTNVAAGAAREYDFGMLGHSNCWRCRRRHKRRVPDGPAIFSAHAASPNAESTHH